MIVLGKVIEAYGVAGWLRVQPFADDTSTWTGLTSWFLSSTDKNLEMASWSCREVVRTRVANGKVLVKLAGIDDRTAAEALKGWFVAVPREALPVPAVGEYYWDDLIGLSVRNKDGDSLGVVVEMIATGANDVMVVQADKQQRLIPFLAHVIQAVNQADRQIEVDWGIDW